MDFHCNIDTDPGNAEWIQRIIIRASSPATVRDLYNLVIIKLIRGEQIWECLKIVNADQSLMYGCKLEWVFRGEVAYISNPQAY